MSLNSSVTYVLDSYVIQRRERFVRRTIEIAEDLYPVRRRAIAEVEISARCADVCGLSAEKLDDVRFGAP